MTSRRFSIAVALLCVIVGAHPACAVETGANEIRAALTKWKDEFNARDSQAVCGLFAPDLVAMFQGQPARDFGQVCTLLRKSLSDSKRRYHYDLDIKDVYASGNLGAVRLVWTLRVTGDDGRVLETSVEPGIDIFQRQPDGEWKIVRYLSYEQGGPAR